MKIDGYTRLAAVVAQPIKHSLSPFIHNQAFELTDENGVYLAWEIEPQALPAIVENVRLLEMYGLNISMPYKTAILPLMDELSPEAALIGAANTVVYRDGKLIGYNTDGIGFFKSLAKYQFDMKNRRLMIIGGGGAAIAIIAQAALLGAAQIVVAARKSASFEPLKARLTDLSAKTGVEILLTDLSATDEMQKNIQNADLLVNASSVGMDGVSTPVASEIKLPAKILVVDAIYKIRETPFLKWAKAQGVPTENGLAMLLGQAAESFQLWTGKTMPVETIAQTLEQK